MVTIDFHGRDVRVDGIIRGDGEQWFLLMLGGGYNPLMVLCKADGEEDAIDYLISSKWGEQVLVDSDYVEWETYRALQDTVGLCVLPQESATKILNDSILSKRWPLLESGMQTWHGYSQERKNELLLEASEYCMDRGTYEYRDGGCDAVTVCLDWVEVHSNVRINWFQKGE